MDFLKEGIEQAKEALEIYERLGNTVGRAECLVELAWLLYSDKQSDAAEEAGYRAINLSTEDGEQYRVCESHHIFGHIYRSKGDIEKAIHHCEVALGIASSFNWGNHLFLVHYSLAQLFLNEDRSDDAQAHIERAKSHTVNNIYFLGRIMKLQAEVWYRQHRLEGARSEALRAIDIFEKLGAAKDTQDCRKILQRIEA